MTYVISKANTDDATLSGDGSTTTFSLSHSLGSEPAGAAVMATSEDASTDFWKTNVTGSAVEITYATAPPAGTDNLTYEIITV